LQCWRHWFIYAVVLYVSAGCCKAVNPAGTVEHLRQFHNTLPKVRKQVHEFTQGVP
jgi:hypothetical protein